MTTGSTPADPRQPWLFDSLPLAPGPRVRPRRPRGRPAAGAPVGEGEAVPVPVPASGAVPDLGGIPRSGPAGAMSGAATAAPAVWSHPELADLLAGLGDLSLSFVAAEAARELRRRLLDRPAVADDPGDGVGEGGAGDADQAETPATDRPALSRTARLVLGELAGVAGAQGDGWELPAEGRRPPAPRRAGVTTLKARRG